MIRRVPQAIAEPEHDSSAYQILCIRGSDHNWVRLMYWTECPVYKRFERGVVHA